MNVAKVMDKILLKLDKERSEFSDFILLCRYKIIKRQCEQGYDKIETLLKYVNELEYRGLKYE